MDPSFFQQKVDLATVSKIEIYDETFIISTERVDLATISYLANGSTLPLHRFLRSHFPGERTASCPLCRAPSVGTHGVDTPLLGSAGVWLQKRKSVTF